MGYLPLTLPTPPWNHRQDPCSSTPPDATYTPMEPQTRPLLIYTASAGSGKTFCLTVRYISLLLRQGLSAYRHTLAVTFTNKATQEMKDRILGQLLAIGRGLPEGEPYFKALMQLLAEETGSTPTEESIRQRCRESLTAILHDYSNLGVSTIDAFFQGVVRGLAHELGLRAGLAVDIDSYELVDMAIDNLLSRPAAEDRGLTRLLQSVVHEQINQGKRWDVRLRLRTLAGLLATEAYLRRCLQQEGDTRPFAVESIREFSHLLAEAKAKALAHAASEADRFLTIAEKAGLTPENLNRGDLAYGYALKIREGRLTDANFSNTLAVRASDPESFLKAKYKGQPALVEGVARLSSALASLHQVQEEELLWVVSVNRASENLTLLSALDYIDQEMRRISGEKDTFPLSRTPLLLKQMVDKDDAPFVFEKTGTRLSNIMIDEMQDTSALSWENFSTLLEGIGAEGGTNMVVGDVKQSIYRWRGGDWRILLNLTRLMPESTITLDTNRRSRGGIVRFNNSFFEHAARLLDRSRREDEFAVETLYHGAEQLPADPQDKGGYIRIWTGKGDEGETEDSQEEQAREGKASQIWTEDQLEDMREQIERLHKEVGVPYGEMAILVRKRKYIPVLANYFASLPEGEVKLIGDEAFYLRQSTSVELLVTAMRLVDDYLHQRDYDPVKKLFLQRGLAHEVLPSVEDPDREASKLVEENVAGVMEELAVLPVAELCERLIRTLRLHEAKGQNAYLLAFMDQLRDLTQDGTTDTSSLLRQWDERIAITSVPQTTTEGIRVMTIHAAKGLQFHTVLLPFLDYQLDRDSKTDIIWTDPASETTPSLFARLGSLPVPQRTELKGSFFEREYRQEHALKRADELNALYVAMTRPTDNLLIWAMPSAKPLDDDGQVKLATAGDIVRLATGMEGSLLERGTAETVVPRTAAGGKSEGTREEAETQTVEMRSYEGRMQFRQSSPSRLFTASADDEDRGHENQYTRRGKVMHYVLSQLSTAEDLHKTIESVRAMGVISSAQEAEEAERILSEALNDVRARRWFSPSLRVLTERSIVCDKEGKPRERRPDRVMIGQDSVEVVDFKFGRPHESHPEQVREYVSLLTQMYPNRRVEGYLWYVGEGKIVTVAPQRGALSRSRGASEARPSESV